jgi:uncharacterized protein (DUF1778 family)
VGKKPAKPRRLGRPKLPQESRAPHRPVLTMRVSQEVYARTVEAARQANRKITEEAGYRLEQSFIWEQAFGEAEKVLDEATRIKAEDQRKTFEDRLRLAGYIHVTGHVAGGDGDVWFNPGANPIKWIVDNRDLFEALQERAAGRATESGEQSLGEQSKGEQS